MYLRKCFKNVTMALACVVALILVITSLDAFASDVTTEGLTVKVENGTTMELADADRESLGELLPSWFSDTNISTEVFVVNDETELSIDWDNSTITKADITYSETTILALNYNEAGELVYSDFALVSDCLIFEDGGESIFMMEQSLGGNDAWNFFYENDDMETYSETYNVLSKINWEAVPYEFDVLENPQDTKNYVFALRVTSGDNVKRMFLLVPEDSYFYEGMLANAPAPEVPDTEDIYEVELPGDSTAISSTDFATVITENATKDVVIKSNATVTFTFAKGTMSAVDGMTSYDFGTDVVNEFEKAGTMSAVVTKDNFVTRINFNYSGKLPATASVRILVGTEYAGKTLYYSKITEEGFEYITSGVVDEEGYVTVTQDSCSDYVLTIEQLVESPKTGEMNLMCFWATFIVSGIGLIVIGMKNKK